jgi:hypothetical protein
LFELTSVCRGCLEKITKLNIKNYEIYRDYMYD